MRALVVYESMYGNTHAVAVDIAAGLRATHKVTLMPVTRAPRELVAAADCGVHR
jgi:flavodoxin